jgi:hypothetical protein
MYILKKNVIEYEVININYPSMLLKINPIYKISFVNLCIKRNGT